MYNSNKRGYAWFFFLKKGVSVLYVTEENHNAFYDSITKPNY